MGRQLTLNVIQHYLTPEHFEVRANKFPERFVPSAGRVTSDTPDVISYMHLRDDIEPDPILLDDSYFTVLRIIYGLDTATNKIKLFYLPDVAQIVTGKPKTFAYQIDVATDRPALFYNQAGNTLSLIQYIDAEQFIMAYRNNMTVAEMSNPANFRQLNVGDTAQHDALGITFSFQTIHNFFFDVPNISFYNIAEFDDIHPGVDIYKHAIALSSDAPGTSDAMCANLGALCPPRCKDLNVINARGISRVEPLRFEKADVNYPIAKKMSEIVEKLYGN